MFLLPFFVSFLSPLLQTCSALPSSGGGGSWMGRRRRGRGGEGRRERRLQMMTVVAVGYSEPREPLLAPGGNLPVTYFCLFDSDLVQY